MIPERLFIPVDDQVRARAFYERAFGFLTLGQARQAANDPGKTSMQAPGAPLIITLVDPAEGMPCGSIQGGVLDVADLSVALAHLTRVGVPFAQTPGAPHQAAVRDPDGNGWILRAPST